MRLYSSWQALGCFASAAHDGIVIQDCQLYGKTSALGLNNLGAGAWVLLSGNAVTNGTKPPASSVFRQSVWFTEGGPGVPDAYEVCRKGAAGNYAWTPLY